MHTEQIITAAANASPRAGRKKKPYYIVLENSLMSNLYDNSGFVWIIREMRITMQKKKKEQLTPVNGPPRNRLHRVCSSNTTTVNYFIDRKTHQTRGVGKLVFWKSNIVIIVVYTQQCSRSVCKMFWMWDGIVYSGYNNTVRERNTKYGNYRYGETFR